jgi:hypothetical protein
MDDALFDQRVRLLRQGDSRRRFLCHASALAASLILKPRLSMTAPGAAVRQGRQNNCPDDNNFVGDCKDLNAFVATCGVICPNGKRKPGKGGCTVANGLAEVNPNYRVSFERRGSRWCATARPSATFSANPTSTVLSVTQSPSACCDKECRDHIATILAEVDSHEQEHVEKIRELVARAQFVWDRSNRFRGCGRTKARARQALSRAIKRYFAELVGQLEESIEQQEEPTQARPINCKICRPPDPTRCEGCKKGECVTACPTCWHCDDAQQKCVPGCRRCYYCDREKGCTRYRCTGCFQPNPNPRPGTDCCVYQCGPPPCCSVPDGCECPQTAPRVRRADVRISLRRVPRRCVRSTFRFRVRVSGLRAPADTLVRLDGRILSTHTRACFVATVDARALARGAHRVTVTVIDSHGRQVKSRSVRFRRCRVHARGIQSAGRA